MRVRSRQGAGELLHQEIAAQGRIERLGAHSLVAKRRVVTVSGEFPVHLKGGMAIVVSTRISSETVR